MKDITFVTHHILISHYCAAESIEFFRGSYCSMVGKNSKEYSHKYLFCLLYLSPIRM